MSSALPRFATAAAVAAGLVLAAPGPHALAVAPVAAASARLESVAAVSTSDAWAVGP